MEVEQRLRLNHRYLVGISSEGVDVQFGLSGLKVDIAERLEASDFQSREFDEHAATLGEALKVNMTLPIQIWTHLLNLEIGHVAYPSAQSAFMRTRAVKLKTLNQPSARKHLSRRAYDLAQEYVPGIHADNVCAARHPDVRLVFAGS